MVIPKDDNGNSLPFFMSKGPHESVIAGEPVDLTKAKGFRVNTAVGYHYGTPPFAPMPIGQTLGCGAHSMVTFDISTVIEVWR